jgi:RNA polymerase sigma factor (sigma-70 family)
MLEPSKIAPGFEQHEELFLNRYRQLRAWALQLTGNDRERAEDLVHDTYIQFTLARPDLNAVENLNGYLYTMMRNLNVSHLRRSQRKQNRILSVVDYDSAELGLRTADPREQIVMQDALRQICQYACMRKQTSKAGSVLILRFLHGYYPKEIAQVMLSTREAVEERLRIARSEVRQYLHDPKSLRFMSEEPIESMQVPRMGFAQTTDQLLNELRQTIFDSRQGQCLPARQLRKLYEDHDSVIDSLLLAHLVSCPNCLDQVNDALGLPLLNERFATDTLAKSRFRDGDGGGGSTTGGASDIERRECRRRARMVSEHRPAELCISINGYSMAAQKVRSDLNEQTLNISVAEKIEFVEVFSEQDVRLLFFSVGETTKERTASVQLSDGRSLEATLSFGNAWPTLQVVYSDPSMRNDDHVAEESNASAFTPSIGWKQFWKRFVSSAFWLRPGTVTAVVALIVITALVVSRFQVTTVSAAELLRRSTAADDAAAGDPQVVLHRTIQLEERQNDRVVRKRIEIWRSKAHGIKLRRVYDDQNNLIAGEWTKPDGTSTIYQRGTEPQARTSPEIAGKAILQTGELWRLDVLAAEFNRLVGGPEALTVEEQANTFVLTHKGASTDLVSATLILNKSDLHAIEQTLTVTRNGEAHVYRFVEAAFERTPADSVAPSVLQPDAELLGPSGLVKDTNRVDSQKAVTNVQPSAEVASAELEIEVTYLLNQIKANLGEQVNLARTPGGSLRVEALVETENRKAQILSALAPVMNNPAIKVEVSTIAEAVKRQKKPSHPADPTVREVEVANNRIPADSQLRSYFATRLAESEAIDEEIKRFANRAMNRSRSALLQAAALKRLVERFSIQEIGELTPEARTKWLAMIDQHAQAYRREVQALRSELRPIFQDSSAPRDGNIDASLTKLADRLVQLSYANDESVRSAFTISAEGNSMALNSTEFWRSLAEAETLVEAIQSRYRK